MAAILLLSRAILKLQAHGPAPILFGLSLTGLAFVVGSSPIWLGSESLWAFAVAAVGAIIYALTPSGVQAKLGPALKMADDPSVKLDRTISASLERFQFK